MTKNTISHEFDFLNTEAMKYEKLTEKKERELLIRISQGDKKAKEILILSCIRYIKYKARKYIGKGIDYEDLLSIGILGLEKAISNFDLSFGCRLFTYATRWIEEELKRAISKQRYGTYNNAVITTIVKKDAAIREYQSLYKKNPSLNEISEEIGVSSEKIKNLYKYEKTMVYLDECFDEEDGNESLYNIIYDERQENELLMIEQEELFKLLKELIEEFLDNDDFTPKELQVIKSLYGLDDNDRKKANEVAEEMNVTSQRISQLKSSFLEKSRKSDKKQMLIRKLKKIGYDVDE